MYRNYANIDYSSGLVDMEYSDTDQHIKIDKLLEIYNGYYVYLTTGSSKKYNLLFVKNKLEDMDYLEIELFNSLIGSLFLKDMEIKTQEYFKSKYPELFYV
jgi:hypothetical protein